MLYVLLFIWGLEIGFWNLSSFAKVTIKTAPNKTDELITTDYNTQAYVKAMNDIVENLPTLIEKLERGFGVSIIKKGEDDNEFDNNSHIRLWNLSKQSDK